MHNKKGISPLIATVLIIGFTILLAVLIVNFILNVTETQTTQTQCEAQANNQCIKFAGEKFTISNINVATADQASATITNLASVTQGSTVTFLVSALDSTGDTLATTTSSALTIGTSTPVALTWATGTTATSIRAFPIVDTVSNGVSCTASCTDVAQTRP